MHIRVRMCNPRDASSRSEAVIVLPSRLSKVEELRQQLRDKFNIDPQEQRLFYGGKLLEDGCTLHDYNIKLNDVIQLVVSTIVPSAEREEPNTKLEAPVVEYKDAISEFYQTKDLVDVRYGQGGWFEGEIIKIVQNLQSDTHPRLKHTRVTNPDVSPKKSAALKSPANRGKKSTPKSGIKNYFNVRCGDNEPSDASPKMDHSADAMEISEKDLAAAVEKYEEDFFLFRVKLYDDEEEIDAKLSNIRPRARRELDPESLNINDTVMLNFNTEDYEEKGYWYDFTVHEVKKNRKNVQLYGTLYHTQDLLLNGITIKNRDKIFAIEKVLPLMDRTKEYQKMMNTETELRSRALNCTTCKDKPEAQCRDCGCNKCAGKNQPDKIILCDECNSGFHLFCLNPPLENLPEDDWYCSNCRRDSDYVIAPGKAKQKRKDNPSKSKRDWGRGMACVGKTQTCTMPANHFGPIPGIEVGMAWRFRIQLSESGVHRPPVSGIHGRDVDGAYSIVLSGGYEDDTDDGFEFTYTGSGGRDLSGNKRTADQSSDQTLTRENRALAKNCAVKEICEDGADAKEKWRDGKPVRVVRSYKMMKHFPEYAPKEGNRYDGIYKVVKYYPETGKSGFRVWKYLLRRDDENPAPWEKGVKAYPIIYPNGYLEAEAEKRALKEKQKQGGGNKRKRVLRESNGNVKSSSDEDEKPTENESVIEIESPPAKKRKTRSSPNNEETNKVSKSKKSCTPKIRFKNNEVKTSKSAVNPFTMAANKMSAAKSSIQNENVKPETLTKEELEAIEKDELNKKLWDECLEALNNENKQGLINKVTTLFLCVICQDVVTNPVTSSCGHNFCHNCLKLAFKSTHSKQCPYCRADLSNDEIEINESLKVALRVVMPGYDSGKK